jgi:hypothetical protein
MTHICDPHANRLDKRQGMLIDGMGDMKSMEYGT